MTTTKTVEDILRPLAEATVWEHEDVKGFHVDQEGAPCPSCERRSVPDPRFEALRCQSVEDNTGRRWATFDGIDASLGAIRKAMVACGWNMIEITTYGEVVVAEIMASVRSSWAGVGKGATDEEAAARALVAAVGDESRKAS